MTPNHRSGFRGVPFALLTILFVLIGASCQAHGLAVFLSTPFTPPEGYDTYQLISYAAFFLLASLLLWKTWEMPIVSTVLGGIFTIGVFYQAFFLFERLLVPNSTAPEPGLGPPNPVFHGLSWHDVGWDFLFWNGLGCTLLFFLTALAGAAWQEMKDRKLPLLLFAIAVPIYTQAWSSSFNNGVEDRSVLFVLIISIGLLLIRTSPLRIIYFFSWLGLFFLGPSIISSIRIYSLSNLALFLFPLASFCYPFFSRPMKCKVLSTGLVMFVGYALIVSPLIMNRALSHGWGGSYFTSSCNDRLMLFARLMKGYAEAHDGRLPQVQTMKELVTVLQPSIGDEFVGPFSDRLEYCPRTIPYSVTPTSFVWIASFSGAILDEISHFPIACPAHKEWKQSEPLILEEMGKQDGINRETRKKFSETLRLAEQGDLAAQCAVGKAYIQQNGVPTDYVKAMKWLETPATNGNTEAQYFLGKLYHYGWGVPENRPRALAWYLQAAELGHTDAMAEVSCMYECGLGLPQDLPRAFLWGSERQRGELAGKMTHDQIEEGKRLIRERAAKQGK